MKLALLLFVLILTVSFVTAQNEIVKVPLKIKIGRKIQPTFWGVTLPFNQTQIISDIPTQEPIKIERSAEKKDVFLVTIGDDNKSKFINKFEIGVDDQKIFTRRVFFKNGKSLLREFEFSSQRRLDRELDRFSIRANYSASGFFQSKKCKIPIALYDVIPDGDLRNDFHQGTNLGLDRNNDGKFYGNGEFLFSDAIIDLCGKNYLISNIAQNGTSVTLKQTNLQNVKLFQESPKFDFTLVNNKSLSSEKFKGKPYLIDFWATWCGPCVAKMPEIKQIEGTIPIIYFNTDTLSRKNDALELMDKLNIKENSVLRTSPKADNFYKSYQRLEGGLPFYVLIDGNGIIRYGGNGGENLKDLKNELKKLGIK